MPTVWTELPALPLYAVCCVILVFKMIFTGWATGIARLVHRDYVTDEDARFMRRETRSGHPLVQRLLAIHRNDVENIPLFFAIGALYVLAAPSPVAANWILGGYTATRLLHTLSYLFGWQPWRSISFDVGAVMLLWMGASVMLKLF